MAFYVNNSFAIKIVGINTKLKWKQHGANIYKTQWCTINNRKNKDSINFFKGKVNAK